MDDTTPRFAWTNVLVHAIWGVVAISLFALHTCSPVTLSIPYQATPEVRVAPTQEPPYLPEMELQSVPCSGVVDYLFSIPLCSI
jgi:hypothetical protein